MTFYGINVVLLQQFPLGSINSRTDLQGKGNKRDFSSQELFSSSFPLLSHGHGNSNSFTSRRRSNISAALIDPFNQSNSDPKQFVSRLEKSWMIRKQPVPVVCETCVAQGSVECPWCAGTGYFILGDNILCEVPSKNTHCHICTGHGTVVCEDCRGTGFRARWLDALPKEEESH